MLNRFSEIFVNGASNPAPQGLRIDDLIVGLGINGANPTTGEIGSGIHEQLANAYANLRSLVEASGAAVENIGQVSFFLADFDHRNLINDPWVEMFPDPDDRPTYKFMPATMVGGELVRLEAFAVAGERRRPIHVDGVAHVNPIPMAVRIGRYLFSSRMLPYDPMTEAPATSVEAQADFIFAHASTVIERAGMSWNNVVQGRAFYATERGRTLLEDRWTARVGDGLDAPPLHGVEYHAGDLLVFLEFIAIARAGEGEAGGDALVWSDSQPGGHRATP